MPQVGHDPLESSETRSTAPLQVRSNSITKSSFSRNALISYLFSYLGTSLLTSPFSSTEPHLLPPASSLPFVVFQNEPSSIIAYALASMGYEHKLAELPADLADQAVPSSPGLPRLALHRRLGRIDGSITSNEKNPTPGQCKDLVFNFSILLYHAARYINIDDCPL